MKYNKSMKKILIVFSLLCLSLAAHAAGVFGLWKTVNESTGKPMNIIRAFERDGVLYGEIVLMYNQNGLPLVARDYNGKAVCDDSVRAENMRGRPSFCGMVVISGLRLGNMGIFSGGTITNPLNGRSYRVEVWLVDNDHLMVRGRWGLFSRTQAARRVTERDLAAILNS